MRVLKGIVLLRTGAEISESSATHRAPAADGAARVPEMIDLPDNELNLDHWTRAQRRTREHSSPGSPADAGCEDWT